MAASTSIVEPWEWRNLYVAALMEVDREKVQSRIAEAEQAIISRARQLFLMEGDHIQEQDAMDDALYALQALRSCLETRNTSPAVA
jgi:hypothetical protein